MVFYLAVACVPFQPQPRIQEQCRVIILGILVNDRLQNFPDALAFRFEISLTRHAALGGQILDDFRFAERLSLRSKSVASSAASVMIFLSSALSFSTSLFAVQGRPKDRKQCWSATGTLHLVETRRLHCVDTGFLAIHRFLLKVRLKSSVKPIGTGLAPSCL